MDNQLLTLSKIFTERLFRIPDYQRGYAWTEKQLKDFWNDIKQLEIGSNHYTGVLTLESVPEEVYRQWEDDFWIIDARSYQPYFVVDGQQRLTTAIILIQAILENIDSSQKINFTDHTDIQRKFIFDSKDNGISRSYVFGYEKDNPSYEFLKTKVFCERSSSTLSQETVYTQNLAQAKQFFVERVSGKSHSEIEILYKKATQHLLFNIFTITEDVDVCVAFETMNNRGKPLSSLELLKNRLIYLSLKFDEPDYERKKLRSSINDCWKAIYHNLGRNKEQPLDDDRFLFTHYVIYFGKSMIDDAGTDEPIRFRRLYHKKFDSDLLENRFVPKNVTSDAPADKRICLSDIYDYVSSLQEAVVLWFKLWNPFESDFSDDVKIWLDKINRCDIPVFHPLLLVFLQKEKSNSNRIAFLKSIERWLFVMSLVDRRILSFNSPSINYPFFLMDDEFQLAIDIRSGKISTDTMAKYISDGTNKILKESAFINTVINRFRSEGFYRWDGIRYFLYEYNLDLQERSKTSRRKINWPEFTEEKKDFVTVEHIYPRNARAAYWNSHFSKLTKKRKASLRDSLGNLLPLSKPKNSSLSNKPFPEKVDGSKDQTIGYRFGCYAENEVAREKDWTPSAILQRGLRMLEFMETRWNIELGNEKQKKKMLGLEFIKK
jgi:hypothetical protein